MNFCGYKNSRYRSRSISNEHQSRTIRGGCGDGDDIDLLQLAEPQRPVIGARILKTSQRTISGIERENPTNVIKIGASLSNASGKDQMIAWIKKFLGFDFKKDKNERTKAAENSALAIKESATKLNTLIDEITKDHKKHG